MVTPQQINVKNIYLKAKHFTPTQVLRDESHEMMPKLIVFLWVVKSYL